MTKQIALLLKPTLPPIKWNHHLLSNCTEILLSSWIPLLSSTFNWLPNFGQVVPPKPLAFIPLLYFHHLCSPLSAWALSLTHEESLQFLQLVSRCLSLPKYLSKLVFWFISRFISLKHNAD